MKHSRTLCLAVAAFATLSIPISSRADDAIGKWVSTAAAGLTLTRGNSDTELATVVLTADKKWEQNELSLDLDGDYGKSKINGTDSTTAEMLHGFVQYNRLFTERFYGYGRIASVKNSTRL